MAASATFALKAGVWFRRGRLLMVSPDSLGTACPLSGRNSTYRLVQISGTSSNRNHLLAAHCVADDNRRHGRSTPNALHYELLHTDPAGPNVGARQLA